MDILMKLSSFVKSIRVDESLSSVLKQKIKTEKSSRFIPQDYFYVTHLINPTKFFWEQKRRDIEKTSEVARKLLLGKRLERIAGAWFRNMPSFFLEEGKLDGVWVDIPGVRGSIDYRIHDSIIEFKTKDELPETGVIVLEKYPQDLEQISFYAILHPDHPKENYLVFMNNVPPYKLRAFKIKIIDSGKLKSLLLNRIHLLKEAIEKDDISKLGRCRYFETGCEYQIKNVCDCSKKEPISTDLLKRSIDISFDENFTKELEKSKESSSNLDAFFSTKDIIAPRKYYLSKTLTHEEEWKSDHKREEYLACLSNIIQRLNLNLNPSEKEYIHKLLKEPRIYIASRWLKIKSSSKETGEILPYTVKVSSVKEMRFTINPNTYFIAELAIICAAYGKSKGLIFTVFPELNDHVQVYEVIFNNTQEILKMIGSVLDTIEQAIKNNDLSLLLPCPKFMNDNERCQLFSRCHKDNIDGCK